MSRNDNQRCILWQFIALFLVIAIFVSAGSSLLKDYKNKKIENLEAMNKAKALCTTSVSEEDLAKWGLTLIFNEETQSCELSCPAGVMC